MTEYVKELCEQLDKEQLIWVIGHWMKTGAIISEILVDESKWHITSEDAIDKIRTTILNNKAANFPSSYNIEILKTELDFFMGKISKKECRERLGLELGELY